MTPPITHIPKSNMMPKPKAKSGRKKTGRTVVTYSFTYEPHKMDAFDILAEKLGENRSTLIKEGLDLVTEKYNEDRT